MLSTLWVPFRSLSQELGTMHRQIDDLFRRTFGISRSTEGESDFAIAPAVNTYTKDNTFFVEAELPGVAKDDLDVSVEEDVLTLRGERKADKEARGEDYFIRESHYGSFVRRLPLPDGADAEAIKARFEDGVLTISMPIEKQFTSARKVLIEGSGEGEKAAEKKVH